MRALLLPLLRCPAGGGPLELEGAPEPWIETGTLICPRNGRRYPIIAGMPHLYIDDEAWQPKAREAAGWVKYHKDHANYDQTGVDIDFQLPYFPHDPWRDIAQQFDIALELANPKPGTWVLDVGAGRGWAAKHFALRGCHSVAVDIVADDQIGLGRSRALMDQAGVVFDALIADSERLPMADGSFDLVFCAAALHHTTNLGKLLTNISRVLRPGGRMVAINEPCVPDDSDEAELRRTVLAEELSYGINETRPRLDDYRRTLRQAGLREEALFVWQAYKMTQESMATWAQELGILPPEEILRPQRLTPKALWRRWRGERQSHPIHSTQHQQAWIDHLIRSRGGVITIVATK